MTVVIITMAAASDLEPWILVPPDHDTLPVGIEKKHDGIGRTDGEKKVFK